MYLPTFFAQHNTEALAQVIRDYPLGILVSHDGNALDADHLPFEFDPSVGEHGVLRAHVARANSLWQRCPSGSAVLVVFRGAQAYVSPNWYPSKHETHRQVPTWNYQVVHAHGVVSVRDDERFLRGLLARLTRSHETAEPIPWKMGDSPKAFIDGMLREIVGIEIAITSLVGKSKLSQNKDERDRLGAAEGVEARGHRALAEQMRKI